MKTSMWVAAVAAGMMLVGSAGQFEAAAQGPRAGEARRGARAGQTNREMGFPILRALQQLDLTPQQKQAIEAAAQEARTKAQAIRQNTSLTPEQRREQMRAVAETLQQKVMALLTTEQKQKLAQMRGRGQGGDRLQEALKQLNLTEAQKTAIANILKDSRAKQEALRASNLSPQEMRAKVQALRQETNRRVLAELTPEQRQKLQQLRPERPERPARPARAGANR